MQPVLWNPDGALLVIGRAANSNRYGRKFERVDAGTEVAALEESKLFSAAKWTKEWNVANTYEEVSELLNELECVSLFVAYMDMAMLGLDAEGSEEPPTYFLKSHWIRVQLACCIYTIKEDLSVVRMQHGKKFCTPHEKYPEIRTIHPSAHPCVSFVLGWYTLFV